MAKAAKEVKKFEFSKVGTILDNISKTVPIRIEMVIKEKEYISTGVYLLDAAISGNLLNGGILTNRITCMAGESGVGKSFIAYSICKQAQAKGYSIIYIDTEFSIELEDLPRLGVDNSIDKFRLIRSNKVEDINITLTQLIDELMKQQIEGYELPKILLVLDSVGQMSSTKEKHDLLNADIKVDFTKAKALGSLFRSINSDLGYLNIPMVVCNHSYETMEMFSQTKLKGGNALYYAASIVGILTKAKLVTKEEDEMDLGSSGITVTFKAVKNRLAKPKKIKFDISFINGLNEFTGLENFCRAEYLDKIGIAKGKMIVDKKTGEATFQPGGNFWYVQHLNKQISTKKLFTAEVFTMDVLKRMAPIVNDYFRFKSLDEINEVEKQFIDVIGGEEEEEGDDFIDAESMDAGDFFDNK